MTLEAARSRASLTWVAVPPYPHLAGADDPEGEARDDQHGLTKGIPMDKNYAAPEFEEYGTVTDLTETGQTNPGGDAKNGSVGSPGV